MRHTWLMLPALLLGGGPTYAAAGPIQDHAGIFSAEATKTADGILADIRRRFEMDVVVETFREIPAARKAQFSPERKAEFFKQWALAEATDRRVHGVYILICMQPPQVQLGSDRAADRRAFRAANRAELVKLFVGKFKQKEFDAGLLEGLEFVRGTVTANLK